MTTQIRERGQIYPSDLVNRSTFFGTLKWTEVWNGNSWHHYCDEWMDKTVPVGVVYDPDSIKDKAVDAYCRAWR